MLMYWEHILILIDKTYMEGRTLRFNPVTSPQQLLYFTVEPPPWVLIDHDLIFYFFSNGTSSGGNGGANPLPCDLSI